MITYRPVSGDIRPAVNRYLTAQWHATDMVLRGEVYDLSGMDGIVAYEQDEIVGLAVYDVRGDTIELMSLNSDRPGMGIGTSLLEQVADIGRAHGCTRYILVTTNDNTDALRYYQRRGFDLVALRLHALDLARRLKPGIPALGDHGIPLRHELELERKL